MEGLYVLYITALYTNSVYMYVYMHLSTTFTMHTLPPPPVHLPPPPAHLPPPPTHSKNVVLNYSDAEAKVREATSNDPWGPSSAIMTELSEYTFHV